MEPGIYLITLEFTFKTHFIWSLDCAIQQTQSFTISTDLSVGITCQKHI